MRRATGPSVATRRLVLERDGGACAWCGRVVAEWGYSLQHRRARGMGGTRRRDANSPANLVTVCGSATTGCHGWVEAHPAEAERRGFRLRQWADPADVPVMYAGGAWFRLDHVGGLVSVSSGFVVSSHAT